MSTPSIIIQSVQTLEEIKHLPDAQRLAVFDLFVEMLGDDVLNPDSPLRLQSDAIGRLADLAAAKKIILTRPT
jgi:hypothetical protein